MRYQFEEPKYDVEECLQRGMNYGAPLKVTMQLWIFDIDEEIKKRDVRDIKEQDVYMGDMPLMTDKGTFIVNGTERVIVSQMHRSPGVFFDHDKGKTHSSGKYLFAARVIPYRGSWLDFEFDGKDLVNVRVDRRRKLPATVMLFALKMTVADILEAFYDTVTHTRTENGWRVPFDAERAKGAKLAADLIDARDGRVAAKAGTKLTRLQLRKLEQGGLRGRAGPDEALLGRYLAGKSSTTTASFSRSRRRDRRGRAREAGRGGQGGDRHSRHRPCRGGPLHPQHAGGRPLRQGAGSLRGRAVEIYRVMRPGEPPTPRHRRAPVQGPVLRSREVRLSAVGRNKMNERLGLDQDESLHILTRRDILECVKTLVRLKDGRGEIDDIDHLGNRRVRSVGELLENQYRMGLLRMERAIRERMSLVELDRRDAARSGQRQAGGRGRARVLRLVPALAVHGPDQSAERVTHKRRLSALGQGGLTRERAGFEVRDVHPTHYGRICPVETPEGPNIASSTASPPSRG